MHRIRLKQPWAASLNADSNLIVYSRKFHKPTGVDRQSLSLKISLHPPVTELAENLLSVQLNGLELCASGQTAACPSSEPVQIGRMLVFPLSELLEFNTIELSITCATDITGATAAISQDALLPCATVIPTFGSFVIESVELQIE